MIEHPLAQKIANFIVSAEGEFNALALELFTYQYEHIEPYQQLCQNLKQTPDNTLSWESIPSVPTSAFKRFELSCAPTNKTELIFHSSGTTQETTSKHYLDTNARSLYELSLRTAWRQFVFAEGIALPIWAIMPPPETAPNSSLSYMAADLFRVNPKLNHQFFWNDCPPVQEIVNALRFIKEPVALFGTAFALMNFFDNTSDRYSLPKGSIVIETGGFKGKSREVTRDELHQLIVDRFGVEQVRIISEYGMSEMASQNYDLTLIKRSVTAVKSGPHWLRTRVIDPLTQLEVSIGQKGVLVHYDLANFNSIFAIATEDLAIRHEDGFELIGRAEGSILRGCSLMLEDLPSTPPSKTRKRKSK